MKTSKIQQAIEELSNLNTLILNNNYSNYKNDPTRIDCVSQLQIGGRTTLFITTIKRVYF